jgi:hypothetical protein
LGILDIVTPAKLYHVVADLDLLKLRAEQAHYVPIETSTFIDASHQQRSTARNQDAARGSLKL